ncbi:MULTISPECIES: helix-turn-helix domain-containing protein [Actinoalloteichus]|nr:MULTISPECIES: helix-turn-helix transcriptional regulator [Actinoalloteichus]
MRRVTRTPRARAVGHALRTLREQKGLSAREVGRRIGIHSTILGRIEGATKWLSPRDLSSLLGALEASPEERNHILGLAEGNGRPGWTVGHVPEQLATLLMYEQDATAITEWTMTLVPGLLQTPAYARAVIHGGVDGADDSLVLTRMGRQQVMRGVSAPTVEVILDESVLWRRIGSRATMADQLQEITARASRGEFEVLVLRNDAGMLDAHAGSFTVWEFADAPPIAHLEHMTHGTFLDAADEVAHFLEARRSLRAAAMTPADSLKVITAAADHHAGGEASP